MKTYFSNEGIEIDPPAAIGPAQTLEERMGFRQPEPIVAGPLSQEFKAILAEEEGIDRRTMNYYAENGMGIGEYFLRAAAASSSSSSPSLEKSSNPGVARVERDVLEDGQISVSEYDASGKLIRGWISRDGEAPEHMQKTIIPDGIHGMHGPAPERVLLSSIFERRATS